MREVAIKSKAGQVSSHRHDREVRHPLPPELIVAEFAGELPPDVAWLVREHVATCESCGARARALAAPYQLLAELGSEPVPYVPDLRRPVRAELERLRFPVRLLRAARALGRGGVRALATLATLVVIAALLVLVVLPALRTGWAPNPVRSSNGLAHVPPAGPTGMLYAQTNKILTVTDTSGQRWLAGEVIAVDEHSGRVVHSLPAGQGVLRAGGTGELPAAVALSPDGSLVYELAASDQTVGAQALLAIDAASGLLRFTVPLAMPDASGLPPGVRGIALAVSPDGQQIYVGLSLGAAGLDGPRALVIADSDATVTGVLQPGLPAQVPEPPLAGALPGVASQTPAPLFATDGLQPSLAAGGALAVSPDGRWLFDAVAFASDAGEQGVVVRRIDVEAGTTEQALALPGDFTLAGLAASPSPQQPLLYLARGGTDEQLFLIATTATGPTLVADVPLGGLAAPPGAPFAGQIAVSPAADGSQVYVSADISADGDRYSAHDIWLVDCASATVASHLHQFQEVGMALANWAGGTQGQLFVLRGGAVALLSPGVALTTNPPLFLSLSDGSPVERLIGTAT
jgi:DNA-binding beta-propeller fold protein YncE